MAAVSDPVDLGAAWRSARPEPCPTRFHQVHGANIRVDLSGTRATRVESFAHGVCFSREPLAPGQVFLLDQLYELNVLPPTARRSRLGVLFCPRPDGTADMHIIINGEDMGPSARGLPAAQPLYAVVDVFASTKSVRLVQLEYGLPSLQTLCRLVIQRSVVHRLAIDGLHLPKGLKDFCKYE